MNSAEIQNGTKFIYQNDSKLAPVIDAAGKCALKPRKDHFYALQRAIINQQLSNKVAEVITVRFNNFFENEPSSEKILNTPDEKLRELGLSWAKVKYVKDLSEKVLSGEVSLNKIHKKNDEQIISELTKIKGIGIWSAQIFLIFNLARPDILPLNDVALMRAAKNVYGLRKMPDEKKMIQLANKYNWAPYKSIACWYLWKSLEL